MYDNTLKEIRNINIGDIVLGCDENLNIVPSIVTNSACTGLSKKWYHIKVRTGQKGTAQILKCTGNHQIFTKEFGWIEAENLQGNEHCFYSKQCYDLTQIQKSILIGKLLGDGTICKQHGNLSISYGHKKKHKQYIDYCTNILGDLSKVLKDIELLVLVLK